MRYLNKIILIESANIRYAEVNVDGNVHFIGTQGVGKSTLLRALLFFYNANQQKLGIPVGKKSFLDFYFPFQNSYIIYEVSRETGMYCILVFKSQGRVCFRFIDSNYNRDHFIDTDGNIFETWDKIKLSFGKDTYYTRKIDRYEDYRNILYGNSQGLGAEFKKYALLESKQYQNIPRAIQHVFLNYKVESEFIKDTIIKSLHEEEINIDLSNYSSHLKNFDTQLNDIKKWTEKTKTGEVIVRKQAENVITTYLAIKYNESEKRHLAKELMWQVNEIEKQQPFIVDSLEKEVAKEVLAAGKITEIEKKFQIKKDKSNSEINVYESKLKDAKKKGDEYETLNIESIIKRVADKPALEAEKDDLTKHKDLLEANFADINQKFEAQTSLLTNQLASFENFKQNEINIEKSNLFNFKEEIAKEYDQLFDEIKKRKQEELLLAINNVEDKRTAIHALHLQKARTESKRFFEAEIGAIKTLMHDLTEKIRIGGNEINQLNGEIETIKTQWDLEKEKIESVHANQKEKINEQIAKLNAIINKINKKLENSKDSLYGWLTKEYPGWENTIGKVIDEENILFKSGLLPQRISKTDLSFYGISIDLNEINRSVKTLADYEKEKKEASDKIELLRKEIATRDQLLNSDLDNLKKKQQSKINKHKETIRNNGYTGEQSTNKFNEAKVSLTEYTNKAIDEQRTALNAIQYNIEKESAGKLEADQFVVNIESSIKKQLELKRKEKDKKIEAKQKLIEQVIESIQKSIIAKNAETIKLIDELKANQKKQLDLKGADTQKIFEFASRINVIKAELKFIDDNNPIAERYKYDKEQLFDKVDHFKNQKAAIESLLANEQEKHIRQKQKLEDEAEVLSKEIASIKQRLDNIFEDLKEFASFKLTDCFKSLEGFFTEGITENKTSKRCKVLIGELNEKYYTGIKKYTDLQAVINTFNGNFSHQNIFKFKTNLIDQSEYFQFSEDLQEFVEEDKISVFEKRVNELFADIIKQVGKEITELLSKEGEIENVIRDINNDFVKRNFAGVIKSIELRVVGSENKIVHLLTEIKKFNDENINDLGASNLFSTNEQTREAKNKKAIDLLTQLIKEISAYKHNNINLSDSFELEFKIVENDNDTSWVQNLANIGSDGTDVLVKAMINIMLLNVFKEGATKNRFKDFRLHCMMDEIGKLHPENVRGILKFANDRNINLINSSPQSFDALAYRYTYKLAKQNDAHDAKPVTVINRLITNNRDR